jgi:hypothetical protein
MITAAEIKTEMAIKTAVSARALNISLRVYLLRLFRGFFAPGFLRETGGLRDRGAGGFLGELFTLFLSL